MTRLQEYRLKYEQIRRETRNYIETLLDHQNKAERELRKMELLESMARVNTNNARELFTQKKIEVKTKKLDAVKHMHLSIELLRSEFSDLLDEPGYSMDDFNELRDRLEQNELAIAETVMLETKTNEYCKNVEEELKKDIKAVKETANESLKKSKENKKMGTWLETMVTSLLKSVFPGREFLEPPSKK